jgi:ribonuclease HI
MIDVWTDGSCLGNPGAGGAAAISSNFAVCHGDSATTNNAMEITAVIIALEKCLAAGMLEATIHTDSTYVKNGIEKWVKKWEMNGWKTAAGQPVKNQTIWKRLRSLTQKMINLQWKWVKGHSGDPGNEKADTLARKTAENFGGI